MTPGSIRQVSLPSFLTTELSEHPRRWPASENGLIFRSNAITEPDADHYKRWLRSMLDEAEPDARSGLPRAIGRTTIEAELGSVSVPTLVILGADDRVADPRAAARLAAEIPGAQIQVLPGIGHVPTITRPQQTADLVKTFMKANTDQLSA